MTTASAFLGIDCGTQGTKALLLQQDGKTLGRGYAKHDIIERANGAREQDPRWWVDALKTSVAAAMASHPNAAVQGIGISGQQHGLVVLDEANEVIRPAKLWNDTETAPQNEKLLTHFGGPEAWIERFGIVPRTGYTVSKLLWLKEVEPQNFARVRHILLPHEYLNLWLTGNLRAEYGDASGTGYFDPRSRKWIAEVLQWIDGGSGQLVSALPQLITPEDAVGKLRPEIADELGLPHDCLVASGGGDNMMGALGTGNVKQGVVTMSLGTSSTVYSYRDAPAEDRSGNVAPFCSSSGGWLPLVCTMNATNVVTQTVELIGSTVAALEPALQNTPPGADGLVWLPFLNGERTPDLPSARGTLLGVSANNYTQQHLIRAMVEGVSFGILAGLELILQGAAAQTVQLIGGGAKSAEWRQLLADATGATIQVPAEEEAGCLGAAIQAMYACGCAAGDGGSFQELADRYVRVDDSKTARPNPANRDLYRAAMRAYQDALHHQYPETAGSSAT
ncbi:xylulokinase [Terriglobus aquaticus]|uniref:Xylulose kinase n=1 Tax=Terriglobus aquaticus TaxID=940139 RepID=A0ABW9KIJ5_9BACT|nr:xylulokinase [Terriglobus aquaticus]